MMSQYLPIFIVLTFTPWTWGQSLGEVRLVGGPASNMGRVEIFYNGQWGTVCDDSWHYQDGDVVCRQLGYERAQRVLYRAYYGQGTGPIWLDQVHCDTKPLRYSLLGCRHNGWGIHDCKHSEDAAVECKRIIPVKPKELPVRLSCPEYSACGSCQTCAEKKFPLPTDCKPQAAVTGIVQAFYNNEWRPVSTDGWDLNAAKVVCGELGFPIAMDIPKIPQVWCNWNNDDDCIELIGSGALLEDKDSHDQCFNNLKQYRGNLTKSLLKRIECDGSENSLLECYFQSLGPFNNLGFWDVAMVTCGYAPHSNCFNPQNTELYRTRGSPVPWKGRVEVFVKGQWGTVGDSSWHLDEGNVVCRALGYGTAKTVFLRSYFGRGIGLVHFNHLRCGGSEGRLSECKSSPVYRSSHSNDAGVECNVPQRDKMCSSTEPKASKISPSTDILGYHSVPFVEVHGPQGWGLLCSDRLLRLTATVICREHSENYVQLIRSARHREIKKMRYTNLLWCFGQEETVGKCLNILRATDKCEDGEAVLHCSKGAPDLVPHLSLLDRYPRDFYGVQTIFMDHLKCAAEENCLASTANLRDPYQQRKLLRFDSFTMNYGTADFVPVLDRNKWLWHSCHNHFHSFEAFIHYDLIDPSSGAKVAEGHKASFCLEDTQCDSGSYPRFRCSTGRQGISVNCGDRYGHYLDCQWIDVTDVPAGRYILRQHVNPDHLAMESDYKNNVIECEISWQERGRYYQFVTMHGCSVSDH